MAEKISSIFGPYATKMQVIIDRAAEKDQFSKVWWTDYFDWGIPQEGLNFETAIGRSRVEAAASIVDRSSSAPLRSRKGIEKLYGEVPAIKEKLQMTEKDYRDWNTLKRLNVSDEKKKRSLLDLIFNDVKTVSESTMKRLDYMVLQGISTGEIEISVTNNPDGVVSGKIPLLMPSGNKRNPSVKWSSSSTATPVTDIRTIVELGEDKGIGFEKILMTRASFSNFQKADETIKLLNGFYRLPSNGKKIGTLDEINEMLEANAYPMIELVNKVIGIENKGKVMPSRPFNEESVVFIPSGKLGIMHNAVPIELDHPVPGVSYATYMEQVLVSKWAQNDPFGEYTQAELNAFPGFESIDSIHILFSETTA